MSGLIQRIRHGAAEQSGFTLIELLMSMLLGLIVIGTGALVFTAAQRSQPNQVKRGNAIAQARTTMERLTREIRQGSTVFPSGATQLSLVTYVHSTSCGGSWSGTAIQCKVTYSCSAGTCTRTEAPPSGAGSGPAVNVVTGLSSSNVFSYSSDCSQTSTSGNPGYVCVTLSFPGDAGDDAITLQDGATPLNPTS